MRIHVVGDPPCLNIRASFCKGGSRRQRGAARAATSGRPRPSLDGARGVRRNVADRRIEFVDSEELAIEAGARFGKLGDLGPHTLEGSTADIEAMPEVLDLKFIGRDVDSTIRSDPH